MDEQRAVASAAGRRHGVSECVCVCVRERGLRARDGRRGHYGGGGGAAAGMVLLLGRGEGGPLCASVLLLCLSLSHPFLPTGVVDTYRDPELELLACT